MVGPVARGFHLLARVVASVDRTRDPLPQLPIAGARRAEQQHKVDWIGIIALAAGLAAPLLEMPSLTDDPWWYPWLLLSYAVSFILCLILRTTRRLFARRLQLQ
jgi:hypothetical protein